MIHDLFGEDELEPGGFRSVNVGNVAVLVLRHPDGEYRAVRDRCPHLGAPLRLGTTQFVVAGDDVGEYRFCDVYAVRCSWHGFEFDADTGRCVGDSRWRVKAYQVSVENGRVCLER